MSNPNNLPVTGFQYIIDAGTVNQSANTIIQAQNIIINNQKKAEQGTNSFDRAVGANGRSVRVLASELVNLAGAGGIATSALTSLLAASGPIDAVIIGIAAAAAALKGEIDRENTAFQTETDQLARLATSYTTYAAARRQAAEKNPLSSEGLSQILNQASEGIPALKGFQDAFDAIFADKPGSRQFVQKRFEDVTKGELALGQVQNDRIRVIGEEITAQAAQGASLSQLFDAVVKMKIATGEITEETVKNREAFSKLVPSLLATAEGYQFVGQAARDSAAAQKIAGQLRDAQSQYNTQIEAANDQHNARMTEIDAQGREARNRIAREGGQARANIERSYNRQIQDINDNLADAEAQAVADRNERIADAEANAQERRVQIDEQLADRRVSIEENYQERIRQINEDYGSSVLDAVANRDAFALLRAQQQKARSLKDAEQQRQKELADAQKEHDKQAKELEAALAKQKAALEKDYEKRIRDLEDNAAKQRQKAADGRDQQLADQKQNEADALADQQRAQGDAERAEKKSYDDRKKQIDAAFTARKQAIIDALADEKNITEQEARAIIESLRSILKPDQITELLNDLQKAIQAKIEIKITPFVAPSAPVPGTTGPDTGPTFAQGGFTGMRGGIVHPYEWVIPNPAIAGYDRWQQVVSGFLSHASRTVQMPGRGGGGGEAHSLDVSISLDNNLLNAQVRNSTMRTMVRVNRGATR